MSYNDTIYSGTSAHSARQIAEELHGHEWDFDADSMHNTFRDLAGAVTTLARTVDQQALEIARQNAALAAVARVVDDVHQYVEFQRAGTREFSASRAESRPYDEARVRREAAEANAAHLVTDPSIKLATPEAQLEVVYLGLAEIWRMAYGDLARHDPEGARCAIEARLRAMLEAAGKFPS